MFVASDYEKFYKVKNDDIVYDLGAFNGRHTILYSRAVGPKGLVVSIEPSHDNYIKLLNAISEYRLTNVIPLNLGILDISGITKIKITDDFNGAANSFFIDVTVKNSQAIAVSTLDQITEMLKITKIDFIKSDIEGAEIEVFDSAVKTLSITQNLAIGSYHLRNGNPTASHVEKTLVKNGFEVITESGDQSQGYTDEIVTYGFKTI